MIKTERIQNTCYHCGDSCGEKPIKSNDLEFCCQGCLTVYGILNKNDLCGYYSLNSKPGVKANQSIWEGKFNYLEKPEFSSKIIQFSDSIIQQATFYIPSMHCSSCLWLLENISSLNNNIISSRVNFINKEVFIVWKKGFSLKSLVELLSSVGYEPYFDLNEKDTNQKTKPKKKRIVKLAVAGFAFSNIMMLSLPEYFSTGHLDTQLSFIFKNLGVLLSIPVLFYCAQEFFTKAYAGLKNRILNIDAPIAVALVIIFLRSLFNIYILNEPGYLDSLSGIVFFMLIGRWLQDKTNETLTFDRDYKSFFPIAVTILKGERKETISIQEIKADDVLEIHHGELIPADAILSKGRGLVDYSFVTGESQPVNANVGEILYAGGMQKGGTIEVLTVKSVSQSYLTNLWNKDVFHSEQLEGRTWLDKLSKYFTYIVFALAGVAAIYWMAHSQTELMWNAITTVLIVACPCALLLAANYTHGHILRILAKRNLYLKNAQVLEELGKIGHVVFDKTGTLTNAKRADIEYLGKDLTEDQKSAIYSMARAIVHPFSKAIEQNLGEQTIQEVSSIQDLNGKGFVASTDNCYITIGLGECFGLKPNEVKSSEIYVSADGELLGKFLIRNKYRNGINELINRLNPHHKITVLSGDNDAEREHLTKRFGGRISLNFNKSPEQKLETIKAFQKTDKVLMIGDGLNDSGALKQGDFGLVVTEHMNNFTPASDGILSAASLTQLDSILHLAKKSKTIVLICFTVSLIYNVIGLYFALQGILSPVIAAILMPLSSLTMMGLTFGLSYWFARRYKLI